MVNSLVIIDFSTKVCVGEFPRILRFHSTLTFSSRNNLERATNNSIAPILEEWNRHLSLHHYSICNMANSTERLSLLHQSSSLLFYSRKHSYFNSRKCWFYREYSVLCQILRMTRRYVVWRYFKIITSFSQLLTILHYSSASIPNVIIIFLCLYRYWVVRRRVLFGNYILTSSDL